MFIDGTEIGRGGYVSQTNRRQELAKLVLGSEFLDKMIVTGCGLNFWVMDSLARSMIWGRTIRHPMVSCWINIGQEFRKASYDMRQLMRWIVLSQPYQLSSRIIDANRNDDPTVGENAAFHALLHSTDDRRQLYQSLITNWRSGAWLLEQQHTRTDRWLRQFVVAFGTDEGDEATTFNGRFLKL